MTNETLATTPNKRRWFQPTLGRLLIALLVLEAILWLIRAWLPRGLAAKVTVLCVGAALVLLLLRIVLALVLRWGFQLSIRSLLLLTIAVAIAFSWLASEMTPIGVVEAREQIRCGRLTLYTFGLRDFDQSYNPETGLPLQGIASCMVDHSTLERATDHNEYIENWIKQGNAPPNSLRRYNPLIADPLSSISASAFVPLTTGKATRVGDLEVIETIHNYAPEFTTHDVSVKSGDCEWSHTIFGGDSREIGVAVVADGKIIAVTHIREGKESYAGRTYQTIQLLDRLTGNSLNCASREVSK